MLCKKSTITKCSSAVFADPSIQRSVLAAAVIFLASGTASHAAYQFLTVAPPVGVGGNAAVAQFNGTNGIIGVTHAFSAGGNGPDDNNNNAIFPSAFPTVFPGTGNVQGHLAQTKYASTSTVTFLMTGYTITPNTVFGMWNTTNQVAQPPYRIELVNTSNVSGPPLSFATYGTQDNVGAGQPLGSSQMVLNPATGDISAGATINGGAGIHTNALFWTGIPTNTKLINVYGTLAPLAGNNIGDGVGYYFAELVVPEPCSIALCTIGLLSLGTLRVRRRR